MEGWKESAYKVFELFDRQWAVVTAGTPERYNGCTVGWGGLGNLWGRRPTVTVYIHPARYTSEWMKDSDTFTVSFFPESYKKALGYLGSHSGRDGDKVRAAGLTPVAFGQSVTYREAELTFLCKKLYQHQFAKEDLAPEIRAYYAAAPKVFPDSDGGWQPHLVFVGEVIGVREE